MLRKAILSVLIALALLSIVLVARAMTMTSLQPGTAMAVSITVDEAGAIERFVGAIRIPTISYENVEDTDSAQFRALHDHFERSYPLVHESLSRADTLQRMHGTDERMSPAGLFASIRFFQQLIRNSEGL